VAEDSERVVQTVIFKVFPELFEHLTNIINDAQASGSIVHVITIVPPQMLKHTADGTVITSHSCVPGDSSCPK
jgi:hypothetical protein